MSDRAWLRPFRNAGILLFGKGIHGLLTLAALALAARALGVRDFGLLALLHGLVMTVAQFAGFASWQTVVRYGAIAVERADAVLMRRIVGFAILLDLIAALFAALIVLLFAAPVAGLIGIPEAMLPTARIYGFTALLLVGGNAGFGVLRLYGRFDLLAVQNTTISATRALGAVGLLFAGAGLDGFLALWASGVLVSRILLVVFTTRELRRRGHGGRPKGPWRALLAPAPGIWRFALGTNLIGTLRLTEAKLGLLVVGALLGPAAAGLYRVAQQFADLVTQPVDKLLAPALLPELTRMAAGRDTAGRTAMVVRPALVAGGLALMAFGVLALAGEWLIGISVGPEFTQAYGVMLLLTFAGLPAAATFSLEPLLVSLGRLRATILARIAANLIYLGLLYVLSLTYGLTGAGIAAIAYSLFIAVALLLAARAAMRAPAP